MSDNSNSTGSTGSSTNSWTLLSPEEAAVENVGPVDDGTESLGDVPSLSEELAGAAAEFKPTDIPIETILSEEGHQICQETSPESSEGPIPSSPSRLSPCPSPSHFLDPSEVDLESQPPVIHDIVTSSPSDNEHLGAIPFVTNIDLGTPLDIPACELLPAEPEESCTDVPVSAEPVFDIPADTAPISVTPAEESPVFSAEPEVNVPTETLTATDTSSHVEADINLGQESTEPPSSVPESDVTQCPVDKSPAPTEAAWDSTVEKEEPEPSETVTQDVEEEEEEEQEPSSSFEYGDTISHDDDGLRRRNVPTFEAQRPRTSDEEDEEEEVEFKLTEKKKEEKPWFSLNTCIAGALVLLFLGSLFLSGDFDASEVSDGEQSQDWLSGDPQDMKELLDKLTQEKQQIAQLEAQLQSQKEELDAALKTVAVSGDEKEKADLEKENVKLKEELSSLPDLKTELEALRARVTELSELTAPKEIPPPTSTPILRPDVIDGQNPPEPNQKAAGPERKKDAVEGVRVKEELQRQKVLLEESRKRLEGMKKGGGDRKHVRDNLVEIQKKLSEQVERWGKKKPQESKWKGNKGKGNERDQWKKDEKKEQRGEKDWKLSKDGGWKEERKEKERKEKEWKTQKQNAHKEPWRKHQDEWERKKDERRMDREERRKEKPWHSKHDKSSHSHHQHHHHHHHHQHQQQQQHNHNDFWRDQEQKLRRNIRPQLGCRSVEDCAAKEGLYPVELSEFEELLEGYLSQLQGSSSEGRDKIRKLTADFFEDGVFIHDRVLFSDFAEDVADILEDTVDVLGDDGQTDDDSLEEQMEEFEREALWKFAATA